MTITVKIPQSVEQAYVSAARTKGVSVDALVEDVLVLNAPVAESAQRPELVEELGIPVLRSGQPLDPSVVADTMAMIRRERDLSMIEPR
ncbi:MAG: hypothetical protein K7J46_12725 [Bryobacter sp.]|jgi:hypothetical protein|nr:hypothetical protein [Bryobacter sp. CoA8 C33]